VTDEVERKFLVVTPPADDVLGEGVELRQGYLAEEGDVEVRLRITSGAAVLTVKAGGGLRRTEVEAVISPAEAEALWPSTEGRRIAKTRHRVLLDGPPGAAAVVAEVDRYADALAGLWTVEVEFDSEITASAFVPPDWFGRELTGDKAWSNAALARHGRPPT
jgi:adenylate cyclase